MTTHSKRFWEYFTFRSLTLYDQLFVHFQQHGFMIALIILGDELKVAKQDCHKKYILSFQNCESDPTHVIDVFTKHMKVCYSVYINEHPAKYRIASYLRDIIREVSNCECETVCYKPR